jgi:hypothetical protein
MERLERPIFIGGCGSSGTTLLQKMLNMHPNIAAGPELSVFDRPRLYDMDMNLFYTLWRNQDFDEFDKDCIINIRVHPGNKSYFAWNRDQYHKPEEWEKIFNEAESPVEFFDLALSEYARKQGKKRWCEKTPNNIYEIEKILEAFPDGQFIEVIRDGRDVVLSLVQRRGARLPDAVYRWITSIRSGYMRRDFNFAITHRYNFLKYENIVSRPASYLRKLCAFIDEDYDPIMLKYWAKKYNTEDEVNNLGYGKKPVFTSSVGKWRKEDVNPTLLRSFELSINDTLENLGYEV